MHMSLRFVPGYLYRLKRTVQLPHFYTIGYSVGSESINSIGGCIKHMWPTLFHIIGYSTGSESMNSVGGRGKFVSPHVTRLSRIKSDGLKID